MQRLKRIGLLIVTNLFIMIGLYIIIFVLENYFGLKIGEGTFQLLIYGAIFGFGGSLVSLWMSRGMAKRMYNIQLIDNFQSGKLQTVYNVVSSIAHTHNIKMPEVGYYESVEPNAFATGPSKSSALVAVSTGLLDSMTEEEISGVVGHEMAHILNGDMVTMTLLQGVINTFVFFLARIAAGFGSSDNEGKSGYNFLLALVLEIVFGVLGSIVVNQFSQHREYKADAGSVQYLGREPMVRALKKLQIITQGIEVKEDEYATLKIFGGKGGLMNLFASHPSLEARIKRLEELGIAN